MNRAFLFLMVQKVGIHTRIILISKAWGFEKARSLTELLAACSALLFILPFHNETFSKAHAHANANALALYLYFFTKRQEYEK
jgi:lipid A disaccharide synthetase